MGTVKSFNDARGYGFILRPDGTEIFAHYTSVLMEGRKTLVVGQRVTFDTYESERGLAAKNIKVIES